MDINWLEDFTCFARTLNFTRAAEERHVTQSAFSRRIQSLESWIGTPLIDRSAYPAKLSPAGEEFLPIAKTVLMQLLRARDEVRAGQLHGDKFYSFAATHSVSVGHLAPILSKLEQRDERIRTHVKSEDMHNCCQLLSDGACDFLLCHRHRDIALTLDEQRFERIDIGVEKLRPFVKPAHNSRPLWKLGESAADIPYLGYSSGSFLGSVVERILKDNPAALDLRHADAFSETLKSLAIEGMGVAWLPESSAFDAIESGALVSAGDTPWEAQLTLSVFADTSKLDDAGLKIWLFFGESH